jgi:hypothetical protein
MDTESYMQGGRYAGRLVPGYIAIPSDVCYDIIIDDLDHLAI